MASKTSAVADEPIDVLFALQPKFNLMDLAGPLEVLTTALHDANDPCKSRQKPTLAAHHDELTGSFDSVQGFRSHPR